MFLLHRNLKSEFGINTGFDFKPYKYGPFDQAVYEALEDLELKKLIESVSSDEHDSLRDQPKYVVTEKGEEYASDIWSQLTPQQQNLLRWVRYKQAERPLGSLLSYVYRNYPDMTTESEISDRIS